MNPVRLVFARSASWTNWLLGHAPASRAGVALFLLTALGAACAVAWASWQTRQEVRAIQDEIAVVRLQYSRASGAQENRMPTLTVQQSHEWNKVARQLNTPWPAILDALESTMPETVALVAVEPDPAQSKVRVQVEAKALDTLLNYAQSLRAGSPFQDVVLHKHETNEQDASHPIRLSLDAQLKPPVRTLAPAEGLRP